MELYKRVTMFGEEGYNLKNLKVKKSKNLL